MKKWKKLTSYHLLNKLHEPLSPWHLEHFGESKHRRLTVRSLHGAPKNHTWWPRFDLICNFLLLNQDHGLKWHLYANDSHVKKIPGLVCWSQRRTGGTAGLPQGDHPSVTQSGSADSHDSQTHELNGCFLCVLLRFCSCVLCSISWAKYLVPSITCLESICNTADGVISLEVRFCQLLLAPVMGSHFTKSKTTVFIGTYMHISSLTSSSTTLLVARSAVATLVSSLSLNIPDKTGTFSPCRNHHGLLPHFCPVFTQMPSSSGGLLWSSYLKSQPPHDSSPCVLTLPYAALFTSPMVLSLGTIHHTFVVKVHLLQLECKL